MAAISWDRLTKKMYKNIGHKQEQQAGLRKATLKICYRIYSVNYSGIDSRIYSEFCLGTYISFHFIVYCGVNSLKLTLDFTLGFEIHLCCECFTNI